MEKKEYTKPICEVETYEAAENIADGGMSAGSWGWE